jgi:deoxyribose-phosphate aldolase
MPPFGLGLSIGLYDEAQVCLVSQLEQPHTICILGKFQRILLKILEFKTGGCAVTGFPLGTFDSPDAQFQTNVGIG